MSEWVGFPCGPEIESTDDGTHMFPIQSHQDTFADINLDPYEDHVSEDFTSLQPSPLPGAGAGFACMQQSHTNDVHGFSSNLQCFNGQTTGNTTTLLSPSQNYQGYLDFNDNFRAPAPPCSYNCSGNPNETFMCNEIKTEPPHSPNPCTQLPPFRKLVDRYLDHKSLNFRENNVDRCGYPFRPYVQTSEHGAFIDQSYVMCRKGKRGAKNVLLWKFILDQLKMENNDTIKWVNRFHGTFRFVDTLEISRKWGERKKKTDMNFEKLSRGIRHYYKSGFMSREDGTRLVYRFHWSKVPQDWRPPEVQKQFEYCRRS